MEAQIRALFVEVQRQRSQDTEARRELFKDCSKTKSSNHVVKMVDPEQTMDTLSARKIKFF